jgi:hypothetical protein
MRSPGELIKLDIHDPDVAAGFSLRCVEPPEPPFVEHFSVSFKKKGLDIYA